MPNFTATVKEREVGQPCFGVLELKDRIGLPEGRDVTLNLPEGTRLGVRIAAVDLARRDISEWPNLPAESGGFWRNRLNL